MSGFRCQPSCRPKKTAGLIEKETEVSCDLYEIKLRAQGVCMRINLIFFVLVLVLVLGDQNFIEDEDEDEVRTL